MSANSSSTSNDSLLQPLSNSGIKYCVQLKTSSIVFTSFHITNTLLLLPLCTFILHHGLLQWRQKRFTSSAVTVSHSDYVTYHMVIMELLRIVGGTVLFFGAYVEDVNIMLEGFYVFSYSWFGQIFFHVLTCVERYLAAVHPIIYLSLKTQRGIRIRNIVVSCVWLLCFACLALQMTEGKLIVNFCLLALCLIAASFCSLSVLCVLIRPGPGEEGGHRERVNQSKLRAFYTITAILGVQVLRFTWGMTWILTILEVSERNCVIMVCEVWFDLPSSLVLPLLYLHRAGKLVSCKKVSSTCKC